MAHRQTIRKALRHIVRGIALLKRHFPNKRFTIDGRLVGDIGETIAAAEYDITLFERQTAIHDGHTSKRQKVQVKATFKEHLTMTKVPDFYLGLKLSEDGEHEVIYNGPGRIIARHYRNRKGIGSKQLSFPIARLRELNGKVPESQRVRRCAL